MLKKLRKVRWINLCLWYQSLRGFYKNPEGIINKPKPNDRIPYAYIKMKDTDLYDYNVFTRALKIKLNLNRKYYKVTELNLIL